MAAYDRLLIGSGGIQDDARKSHWREGCSLCIGLGGTGKDAVKKLKREVYQRMKPDDPEAAVPGYEKIRFLIVDADDSGFKFNSRKCQDIDTMTEVFGMYNRDMFSRIQESPEKHKEFSWYNRETIPHNSCAFGVGSCRQRGRMLLIEYAHLFQAKLLFMLRNMVNDTSGGLNIHIFTGLSGGTGSGSFVDICYILRHVLESMGMSDTLIQGHFFLSDVNLSEITDRRVRNSPDGYFRYPSLKEQLEGNCYAALKELDYLMNLEKHHGRFVQDYGNFKIDTNRPPVDICNLISATGDDGAMMENGYDCALSIAVDYVIANIAKGGLPTPETSSHYNIIGFTHGEIPFSDIFAYLGFKLFQRFDDIFDRKPTPKDLSDFLTRNQLNLEQLMRQLTKGITYAIPYPQSLIKSTNIDPGDKRVIGLADTWTADELGALLENRRAMLKELAGYDLPEKSDSIISRIFAGLYADYVMNPDKGLFFAARLLEGEGGQDLISFLDTLIQIVDTRRSDEQRREVIRKEELSAAEQTLAKANFINRKRRIREYLAAVENWYLHMAYIDQYNVMYHILRELKDQVIRMNAEFFQPMTALFSTLKDIFCKNGEILRDGKYHKRPYIWQVVELSQVKNHLDRLAEDLDSMQEMKKLTQLFLSHRQEWIDGQEDAVIRWISQYMVQTFPSVSNKNMDSWLDSTSKNAKIVVRELFDKVSDPPFWEKDSSVSENVEKRTYLLIPQDSPEVAEAAEEVKPEGCQICPNHIKDRLTVATMYLNVPLRAYKGLADLEAAYNANPNQAGRHLYEAGDTDWREILPPPGSEPEPAKGQMQGTQKDAEKEADAASKL